MIIAVETSTDKAVRLAAVLNEIDDLFGQHFNDFHIIEFITDYGPVKFGVDMDAFNAVEVCWPAMVCNQYRFIIPVGSEFDRAVVLWNRLTGRWEVLPDEMLPSFIKQSLPQDQEVVVTA